MLLGVSRCVLAPLRGEQISQGTSCVILLLLCLLVRSIHVSAREVTTFTLYYYFERCHLVFLKKVTLYSPFDTTQNEKLE